MAILFVLFLSLCATFVQGQYYAGVVQHVVIEASTPRETIEANLAVFQLHAEMAGKEGVDILVFPEFGLGGDFTSRDSLFPFVENIPDATQPPSIPCLHLDYQTHPISVNASCWARQNNLTIAIEYYDLKYCDQSTDPNCPADGRYQFNAEVIFDETGAIIAKYYKFHEWFSLRTAIDMPAEVSLTTFTKFGVEFGIFICFDIAFPTPAIDLVKSGVKHFVFSVAMDMFLGKEIHRRWSKLTNTVLLSSNLGQRWSGMYSSGEELDSRKISIPGFKQDSLLVAFVPGEQN